MDKRQIYHIVEWVVALAACGWLIWKMATYDNYAGLWATICGMTWKQVGALVLCVALMPVNMSIEAWRWKTLMDEGMSWREAHREVYYSKLAGLITPWRLGEYPARALLRNEWAQTLSMGAVGSATMTMAIIAAGLTAMVANGEWMNGLMGEWWITVAAVVVLLVVGLAMAPRILRRWATVSRRLIMVSFGQSVVRLLCWCGQLALVLYALGAGEGMNGLMDEGLLKTPIYYLFVTITPNVPIAEVGVRGAWAIAVFGSMNAALAGVLLWVINTVLPCLIWPFLRKKT